MQHVMMVGNHTSTKMANDGIHEKRRQYMQHVDNRTSTKMATNDHDLCGYVLGKFRSVVISDVHGLAVLMEDKVK